MLIANSNSCLQKQSTLWLTACLSLQAARHKKRKTTQFCFWTGLCKTVEDAPSHVEKEIDYSGAQNNEG